MDERNYSGAGARWDEVWKVNKVLGNPDSDLRLEVYPRNLVLAIIMEGFWQFGYAFIVLNTVQAGFLSRLGASEFLVGLYIAIPTIAMCLVPLFGSHLLRDPSSHRAMVIWLHVVHVVPWGLLGGYVLFGRYTSSAWTTGFMFVTGAVAAVAMGFIVPLWFDFMTNRIIPPGRKGHFFGITIAVGSAAGVVGAYLSKLLLKHVPYPANFAYCFLMFGLMGGLSVATMSLLREGRIPNGVPQEESLRRHLQWFVWLVRNHVKLRRFFLAAIVIGAGASAANFYGVYAVRRFGLPSDVLGSFSMFMVVGQSISSALLGRVGDRKGHHKAYLIAVVCLLGSLVVAAVGNAIWWFYGAFLLFGAYLGYAWIGPASIITDIAPQDSVQRYMAAYYAIVNPFLAAAPPVMGALIRTAGYRGVFMTAFAVIVLGIGLLYRALHSAAQAG